MCEHATLAKPKPSVASLRRVLRKSSQLTNVIEVSLSLLPVDHKVVVARGASIQRHASLLSSFGITCDDLDPVLHQDDALSAKRARIATVFDEPEVWQEYFMWFSLVMLWAVLPLQVNC